MRLGLLSDTHIPLAASTLPPHIAEAFRGVDLILHAGDIYIRSVPDELERVAPVLAAIGDDDYRDTLTDKRAKPKHMLRFEEQTLYLVHESHYYYSVALLRDSNTSEGADANAADILVLCHAHRRLVERHNGTLFVNPGSLALPNYHTGLGTVAILDIDPGKAEANPPLQCSA